MTDRERIEKLEKEIAILREEAKKADAFLSLMTGTLLAMSNVRMPISAETMLKSKTMNGWQETMLEKFNEGQQSIFQGFKQPE